MPSQKTCPRCLKHFECWKENILLCACNQVKLSPAETAFIGQQYNDCLCVECLKEIKKEFLSKKNRSHL